MRPCVPHASATATYYEIISAGASYLASLFPSISLRSLSSFPTVFHPFLSLSRSPPRFLSAGNRGISIVSGMFCALRVAEEYFNYFVIIISYYLS